MYKKEHVASAYEMQIDSLIRLLLRMKMYVTNLLSDAKIVIYNYSEDATTKSMLMQKKIQELNGQVDESVISILALRHPMAADLRFVISSLKIARELEYMGDWTKKSLKAISRLHNDAIPDAPKAAIIQMINVSIEVLDCTISVLLKTDVNKDEKESIATRISGIIDKDDIVDNIYKDVLLKALPEIKEGSDKSLISYELIGIAKNFEKVADCANNIALETKYVLTGSRDN